MADLKLNKKGVEPGARFNIVRSLMRFISALLLIFTSILNASSVTAGANSKSFIWPGVGDGKFLSVDSFNGLDQVLFDSAHSFDALHYRLNLFFPMQSDYYFGSVTVDFQVVDSVLSEIRLNMIDLTTDSVFDGDSPASFTNDDTSIVIHLNGFNHFPDTLLVTIFYHKNSSGSGYYHYERNSYTMSEPQDARRWFPCYDEPWDKATSDIYVTLPETCRVGSNGILTESWNDPGNGTMTYHWVNNYQIATYLINLIMGNYATWTDYYISPSGDSLPIFNMCWREDSAAAAYDFAIVPNMIGIYSRLFYPYPFEKYGQGVVAPFAYGGMENQTMTTFNRSWITGDRLYEFGYAHELAHMWWGDFVTLADWRHIWLNEGFATYSSALYTEDNYGLDAFAANMLDYQNAYFAYDRDIGRYPIYNPSDLFGAPVYVKGAWILHMLRGIIGDQQFFSGLHQYAARYAYANASTSEFRSVMEGVSGLNLQRFFDQWVFDQGFPEYAYDWTYEVAGDSFLVHLEIDQNQSNAPIFEMPLRVRVHSTFDYDFTFDNNQAIQTYDFLVPTAPIDIILDPDNWVLKKVLQGDNLNEGDNNQLPESVELINIYPNPFNGATSILFNIEGNGQEIRLSIYDIQGRQIRNLSSNYLSPDQYLRQWDGRDDGGLNVSSGIYLVRLSTSHSSSARMITYLK